MTNAGFPELRGRFAEVARTTVLDDVPAVESYQWPARSMRALAEAGLFGLAVPERFGGLGMGMTGLAIAGEELGRISGSVSLCFCMHVVGSAVIAAKVTDDQAERYLIPIARGQHLTTLALSEPETGVHFYEPISRLERDGDDFRVTAHKSFVTNGGHADSYVISTMSEHGQDRPGVFNCLIVDAGTPGLAWQGTWQGLGMRGNSSISMCLEGARVPVRNLLGQAGDQTWYIFHVVAPYFLIAMAATYVGIAQSAVDFAIAHVRDRVHARTGRSLAEVPAIQDRIARMWTAVQQARLLLIHAAERGDLDAPDALTLVCAAKMSAAETAIQVTNEAMTCVGGIGYRENSMLWTLLRDARAADVMSPTTDVLRSWTARSLLDLPILSP
jgi:alkylation response protein AidB-like acyl-CoA dehydrogenase